MAEGSEPRGPVRLETEQLNSIKAAFQSLDESNTGQVAKSRLQVLCASLCRDCEIAYTTDDLDAYKPGQKTMGSGDLVDYLQEELLPKGKSVDNTKLYDLCWRIVQQKFMKLPDCLLSEKEAHDQWLIFNILDIDSLSRVDKEELAIVLEKFSQAMGKIWDPKSLLEFCPELEMTFWQYLECLQKKYIQGSGKSVYKEALEEVVDHIVNNVIKQGHLTKKGHKVRSMKERWFVLKPGGLSYYTTRKRAEKKGEVPLNKATQVEIVPDKGRYRFAITCGGDKKVTYELEAKDQRERQEWVSAIQIAIDTCEGPPPQKTERLERKIGRNARRLDKLEEERKKREQENLLQSQQQELDLLREKYSQAEVQAAVENALLQEEIKRREELEKLHQELEKLLEAERRARETEEKARTLQEQLLAEEKKRLQELEKLKSEKEQLLDDEKKAREGLEERQKEQERLLEEERKRLEELDAMRQAAEQAMLEAQDKLTNAENAAKRAAEEAKERARDLKTSVGLAQPLGPRNPTLVTHRGQGAFCELDFAGDIGDKRGGETVSSGEVVKASVPTRKGIEEIDAQLDSILRRFKERAEGTHADDSVERTAGSAGNAPENDEERPEGDADSCEKPADGGNAPECDKERLEVAADSEEKTTDEQNASECDKERPEGEADFEEEPADGGNAPECDKERASDNQDETELNLKTAGSGDEADENEAKSDDVSGCCDVKGSGDVDVSGDVSRGAGTGGQHNGEINGTTEE